ncbi:MAG TPA: hypothetical protein VG448_12520 [Solirubrobacterales bacterium]|nr:hypothetical protein [Solirubrobacterales bacterium]
MTKRRISRLGFSATLFAVLISVFAVTAGAASAAPVIRVSTLKPDYVTSGKSLLLYVNVMDVGDEPLSGNLTITYTFPEEISPIEPTADGSPSPTCTTSGQVEECVVEASGYPLGRNMLYTMIAFVDPGATGILTGQVEVSGGGAGNAITVPLNFDTGPTGPFAIDAFEAAVKDSPALVPAQAGSTPTEVDTAAQLRSEAAENFKFPPLSVTAPPENMRDVIAHVPAGLVGYPIATPQMCNPAQLQKQAESGTGQVPNCPRDSQIGLALVNGKDTVPVYNVPPPLGAPAMFAFYYQGVIVNLRAKLRQSDYGIDIVTSKVSSSVPITKFEVQLWGVPADSSHDGVRAECTEGLYGAALSAPHCPSTAPHVPFLRLPTSCSGPLPWSIDINTYVHPETFNHASTTSPALADCEAVPFDPSVSLVPTNPSAHVTSGLQVDLSLPQASAPEGISSADVRLATVALPQGVSLNPAAARGLEACSDGQLRLGLEGPAECPDASQLGTVEVKTPLLEEPLGGSVYLRAQNSQDPESGQMYRLAIVLHSAERGVDVKLPGSLIVNKDTGQLTTTFDELPQLPFESMQLNLDAGPRAPLTTPQACGTYNAQATLEGWNGKTVSLTSQFSIDQGCTAPGFAPGFAAGASNPTAGAFSPFTLRVTRDSGMPNLSRITATLPEGELAKLKGVPLCGNAQAETSNCPASSRIGKVVTAVGEGSSPLYLPQPGKSPTAVYLAGPYKSAPYSVVAAVPAQSGPFDLGTVTVRSALRIDPETVQATVASDPLPQIFGGIPVTYRDVRVEVDRPNFTLNPTDCEPMAVTGTIDSAAGGSAQVADRFQVVNCAALGFRPKLAISLKGKPGRTGHPALTAVVTYPKKGSYANIARTSVSLPGSEFLASNHIRTSCTRVQYNAGAGGGTQCPKGSIYGHARAFSPLLDKPLEGPVYMRSNGGERELPDLVASLDGQIHVDLVGYVDSNPKTKGLRTTFAKVPDAPVSRFVLKMPAGKKSLLENSTNICAGKHRAVVKMKAQNGRVANFRPLVRAKCGKRGR